MTRWRLSDHDEWALHRLAQHTGCDEDRPRLCQVHVRGGWAMASDSYRVLALPVETNREGAVHRSDAWTGGTVDLDQAPGLTSRRGGAVRWIHDETQIWDTTAGAGGHLADLTHGQVLAVSPTAKGSWPIRGGCVSVWPSWMMGPPLPTRPGVLVMADGARVPAAAGAHAVVSARLLAPAVAAVSEAHGSEGVQLVGDQRVVLALGPGGEWRDGWAAVAGVELYGADRPALPAWVPVGRAS